MRAALVENDDVINVIEYDPESNYDPGEGVEIVELTDDQVVGPGWVRQNGSFYLPVKSLSANPMTIPPDNTTVSMVTYTNTYEDAPASVTFDVNGATATVTLEQGVAQIEVTAATPDDIVVSCDDETLTIMAEVPNATS